MVSMETPIFKDSMIFMVMIHGSFRFIARIAVSYFPTRMQLQSHPIKGALHTIDRPCDKLDPFGIIDFLHHKIGTTHVAHHFDSTIPHYKAQVATDAIKASFPEYYLYDPTPIPQALWRIAKGCTAVEQRGDKWVWNNAGLEDQIE